MFFFKQKTAYEMRISDWSSDVCSSDLDALVIIAFEPPEQIALVRQEQRAFGFEPVRRESFEADRRIAAVWPFAQIRPHAGLKVEIGADRPAVEQLEFGRLDAFAPGALPLALQRQAVDVAAIPALDAPAESVAALACLIFGEIEVQEGDRLPAIFFHHRMTRPVHLRLGV